MDGQLSWINCQEQELFIHGYTYWNEFWTYADPDANYQLRIMEECWDLEASSAVVEFPPQSTVLYYT